MNKKVVVCDHIHQDGIEILKNSKDIDLVIAYDVEKDKLKQHIYNAALVITRSSTPVDEAFLDSAKELKYIIRAGVGVDNVDINACSKRGIIVMNVPTANTIAAVEMTMAHILATVRSFPYAHAQLKDERVWKRENWYGTELYGKKLGVIGFGNIGSRVALRSKSFEMDVIAYDPYISSSKVTELGMTYTSNFDDILSCDIITIHTPKNKETIGMIGKQEIEKMKDGVILINVARGGLYDEKALYDGLKSNKVRFAGVDVFSYEPATDHFLLELPNITVTPHLGANTKESQIKISVQAAQNAIDSIKGISFPNALNLPIKENEMPEWAMPYFELAQKISFLAAQLVKSPIKSLKVSAYGEIKTYLNSLLTFSTVGALKEAVDENINYVNANFIANERGIKLSVNNELTSDCPYKNKITIQVNSESDTYKISGTIFEGTSFRIIDINGFDLDVSPKGKMIYFENSDVPGVIAEVGATLAKNNINIADFRLGRDLKKSKALAVIVVDDEVDTKVIQELSKLKAAIKVRYAEL